MQKRFAELDGARAAFRATHDLVYTIEALYEWFRGDQDYYAKLARVEGALAAAPDAPLDVYVTLDTRGRHAGSVINVELDVRRPCLSSAFFGAPTAARTSKQCP